MSRAYQVGFEATCSDNGNVDIKLIPILPKEVMSDLLRKELENDGWKKDEKGSMTKEVGSATVSLPPDRDTVTISVELTKQGIARSDTDYNKKQEDAIVERAKQALEQEMKEKVTQIINDVEPKVQSQLDAVIRKIYVEALKQKAASMGNIESISETRDSQGLPEVVIKVAL